MSVISFLFRLFLLYILFKLVINSILMFGRFFKLSRSSRKHTYGNQEYNHTESDHSSGRDYFDTDKIVDAEYRET